jgi:hypothetical protein
MSRDELGWVIWGSVGVAILIPETTGDGEEALVLADGGEDGGEPRGARPLVGNDLPFGLRGAHRPPRFLALAGRAVT